MVSASSAGSAELRPVDRAASIAWPRNAPSITEEAMANAYEDEDVIYIDIQFSTGVGTDTDGKAGSTRTVETGAEFDYLPENCGGAGVENEVIDCRG